MIELKSLGQENFHHFIELLRQRGEAPEDYYRWKYLAQPIQDRPPGFIAFVDGNPVGCIGIVNRIYKNTDSNQLPATWFADWYVTDAFRGMGVGQYLMEAVGKLAGVNFGIPGPVSAQAVCKGAGYHPLDNFFDYTIYLNPFRCGYARFGGSKSKRILRGILFLIRYNSWLTRKIRNKPNSIWSAKLTYHETWKEMMDILMSNQSTLCRDEAFIDWINSMPVDPSKNREWWAISNQCFFACGFAEDDYWKLRKARIMEIVLIDESYQYEQALQEIVVQLYQHKSDWISFGFKALPPSIGFLHSSVKLPLFMASTSVTGIEHLSSLDKESTWREFEMR